MIFFLGFQISWQKQILKDDTELHFDNLTAI